MPLHQQGAPRTGYNSVASHPRPPTCAKARARHKSSIGAHVLCANSCMFAVFSFCIPLAWVLLLYLFGCEQQKGQRVKPPRTKQGQSKASAAARIAQRHQHSLPLLTYYNSPAKHSPRTSHRSAKLMWAPFLPSAKLFPSDTLLIYKRIAKSAGRRFRDGAVVPFE